LTKNKKLLELRGDNVSTVTSQVDDRYELTDTIVLLSFCYWWSG